MILTFSVGLLMYGGAKTRKINYLITFAAKIK